MERTVDDCYPHGGNRISGRNHGAFVLPHQTLSQNPEKLYSPFELGEILFASGNFRDAAIFYREALSRRSPDDAGSARDRAWILFQVGNCLRNSDPAAAAKMYGQLTTEYPNCPWAPLAEAQRKLMDWYQKDQPRKLIAENGASGK